MRILKVMGILVVGLVMLKFLFLGLGIFHLTVFAIKLLFWGGILFLIAKALGVGKRKI